MNEAYTVADTCTGVYQPVIHNIQLNASSGPNFKILTNKELSKGYEGYWDKGSKSCSSNERWNTSVTIGNYEYPKATVRNVRSRNLVKLLLNSNIYITCPELATYNFHSPTSFSNAVVKKSAEILIDL